MSVARHTGYNIVGGLIPLAVALFTIPLYLRIIGPDRFGLLSIAFLILGYFGIFDLGLGRAVAHRVAASGKALPLEQRRIVGTAILCNLGIGAIGGAILWGVAWLYFTHFLVADDTLRQQMIAAIPALVLSVPITALTGVLSGALEGRSRFAAVNVATTLASVLFHLLPLASALWISRDLDVLVLSVVIARLVGVGLLAALCFVTFGRVVGFDKIQAHLLMRFGGWVAVSSIIGPLMIITDRFVIGAMIGAGAVAAYTVPFELAARSATIPTALGRALFPALSRGGDADVSLRLADTAGFALAAVMTPLIVTGVLGMETFLSLWLGAHDPRSVAVGQIIMVAFWLNALSYVPLTLIQGQGRPSTVAKVHCLELLPYLALLYVLTDFLGLMGAALAFLIRCAADYLLLGDRSGLLGRIVKGHARFAVIVAVATGIAATRPGLSLTLLAIAALVGAALLLAWTTAPPQARALIRGR